LDETLPRKLGSAAGRMARLQVRVALDRKPMAVPPGSSFVVASTTRGQLIYIGIQGFESKRLRFISHQACQLFRSVPKTWPVILVRNSCTTSAMNLSSTNGIINGIASTYSCVFRARITYEECSSLPTHGLEEYSLLDSPLRKLPNQRKIRFVVKAGDTLHGVKQVAINIGRQVGIGVFRTSRVGRIRRFLVAMNSNSSPDR
jgi:hypothetical protein